MWILLLLIAEVSLAPAPSLVVGDSHIVLLPYHFQEHDDSAESARDVMWNCQARHEIVF